MSKVQGKCLCGRIEMAIEKSNYLILACHCGMCRRQAGGPIHWLSEVQANRIEIIRGKEFISTYQSSKTTERSFCRNCGTILFWRKLKENLYCANAELFDEVIENGKMVTEFFYDRKPDYYAYQQETKKLDSSYQKI